MKRFLILILTFAVLLSSGPAFAAGEAELNENPRARSAKLRIAEKL